MVLDEDRATGRLKLEMSPEQFSRLVRCSEAELDALLRLDKMATPGCECVGCQRRGADIHLLRTILKLGELYATVEVKEQFARIMKGDLH